MFEFFVIVPPGLESLCTAEIRQLGLPNATRVAGGVACRGGAAELIRIQAGSRIASRVLVRLSEGPLADLRRQAAAVDFAAFLAPGSPFSLEETGGGSRPAELLRPVEEAIRRQVPGAHAVAKAQGVQHFVVRLAAGRVLLRIDASGDDLHMRGYRQETGVAPLRENLAAGILALAGWTGETPLFDPMCGSGTFLIEGALLSARRPPGAGRSFACERWPCMQPGELAEARAALRSDELPAPRVPIHGSDRNAGALGVARRNAQRAGVLEHLHLARADATLAVPPSPPGLLVTNPPYGKRVGDERELEQLYRGFGQRLRTHFPGWRVAVLIADTKLAPALQLPSPASHALRNGGLPCTLLVADMNAG